MLMWPRVIFSLLIFVAVAKAKSRNDRLPEAIRETYSEKIEENIEEGVQPPRIVGGVAAKLYSRPFQASIQLDKKGHFCGGAIINQKFVLTAAHCCGGASSASARVVVGKHDLKSVKEEHEQVLRISRVIIHKEYNSRTIRNDICLLEVAEQIKFSRAIQQSKLPSPMETFSSLAKVSGWGTLSFGGSSSSILQGVIVPIVSDKECKINYGDAQIAPSMICAGSASADSCQGDSGGPLTCGDEEVLCGVASWGRGCALRGFPGVYTEVAHYVDWIQKNAQEA